MKKFPVLPFVALFAAVACSRVLAGTVPDGPSGTTDDAVAAMSTIKRPSRSTPAPANGVKKPFTAILSKEDKGGNAVTSFASTTPKIYLQWSDDSATAGEKLRVVWIAEAAGKAKRKTVREAAGTLPGPNSLGSFFLNEPAGGFAPGKYHVDAYEDGKLVKTLPFEVTK